MLPVLKPKICSTRARRRDFARFDRFCFWLRAWPRPPFSPTGATMSLAVKILVGRALRVHFQAGWHFAAFDRGVLLAPVALPATRSGSPGIDRGAARRRSPTPTGGRSDAATAAAGRDRSP